MKKVKLNSYILFYFNKKMKWLTKILADQELHTHIGIIKHNDAIGKIYGSRIITNKNKYVYLFRPTIHDFVMKIQHGTQIVYPKDLGYISSRAGLQSGQKIVEIGTGSGALTIFLAGVVKPNGHVYTFDVNQQFIDIAKKNVSKTSLDKYITFKKINIKNRKSLPIKNADLITIDLGDPWSVIKQARLMLKDSGSIISICPTINQLEKLSTSLIENEFTDIECVENIVRNIDAREGKTRHSFYGIGHTTYLVYARKAHF